MRFAAGISIRVMRELVRRHETYFHRRTSLRGGSDEDSLP